MVAMTAVTPQNNSPPLVRRKNSLHKFTTYCLSMIRTAGSSELLLATSFGFSVSVRTATVALVPNTLLMVVLVAVVLGATGDTLPALVIIRFATVVTGTTSLVILCTAAMEMKNRILFDDMQFIRALQSSAELLLRKILPRAANKGLDSLLSVEEATAAPVAAGADGHKVRMPPSLSQRVEVERCDDTTVIESDLVGSTALAATLTPIDVCIMLHDLYSQWDTIADTISSAEGGIVKITTIGDAYIAVAGPAFGSARTTAESGALSALRMTCLMIEAAAKVRAVRHGDLTGSATGGKGLSAAGLDSKVGNAAIDERLVADVVPTDGSLPGRPIGIRIGCSSGTIFGAVLGVRQFQWQVWGPALSEATRFEETGTPGKVHASKRTCALARSAITALGTNISRKLVFDAEEVARVDDSGGKPTGGDGKAEPHGFYVRFA